ARLVVARLRQRLDDERALERIEVDAAGGKGRVVRLGRGWRPARGVHRQMLAANQATVRENDGAFNRVAQLAHVAGPRIGEQIAPGLALEPRGRPADGLADFAEKQTGR